MTSSSSSPSPPPYQPASRPDYASYSSWGRFPRSTPSEVLRLYWLSQIPALSEMAHPLLPRGEGRSYGDSCLNNGGILLDTRSLDRFVQFDAQSGRLRCEAGVTLDAILQLVVPKGWFLPVTPGTKFVTVGGAVANDVHGKNHHRAGSFGCHAIRPRWSLLRSDGERTYSAPSNTIPSFSAPPSAVWASPA